MKAGHDEGDKPDGRCAACYDDFLGTHVFGHLDNLLGSGTSNDRVIHKEDVLIGKF